MDEPLMGWPGDDDGVTKDDQEALLDEIDRLRAEVERLREAIKEHRLRAAEVLAGSRMDAPFGYGHDHELWAELNAARSASDDAHAADAAEEE